MLVLSKESFAKKIEIGDLVQDKQTGDYFIVGFKDWDGGSKTGYFVFDFTENNISGIYSDIGEMVTERDLQLVAKKEDLVIAY